VIATALWKPWYVYQPRQILRRVFVLGDTPPADYQSLRTAWGMEMMACPAEHLGRCLWTTGVYDLAVSELMFRLVRPGDVVVDAGANIGYMTLLAAVAAGARGRVIAFEPNPHLFPILRQNVETAQRRRAMAPVDLRQTALGDHRHWMPLVLPDPSEGNNGLGHISTEPISHDSVDTVSVEVETLDGVLAGQSVALAKVDVEGYERQLFEGCAGSLGSHRIRHVVFEDHQGIDSAAATFLAAAGYTLFSIGWSMRRPLLVEARPGQSSSHFYEAPSYLATIDPAGAVSACHPSGWRALRRQIQGP
jgi:FkbM family methyltransferase